MELANIKPKTTVIGIGGAGVKTVKHLASLKSAEWLNIAVADADMNTLNEANLENSFPMGIEWTRGLGCGGNYSRGASAFAHKASQKELETFISGSSMLIVTGGLGGGAATGGAPIIGRLARRLKIPVVFILTTPFAFEGHGRHETREEGIKLLLSDADVILPIPNDILFTSLKSDVPAKQAFSLVDESIANAILGIAEVLRCGNMLATDFSDFKEILTKKKTVCRIALGEADAKDGDNRCNVAAERLLQSPLLGGQSGLKEADAVIMTVIGGEDFQIGEMKQSLEIIKSLTGFETRIITGINTDIAYNGKILITLIAITYEEKDHDTEIAEPVQHQAWCSAIVKPDIETSQPLLQPELAFQSPTRGYFSKTALNIVKGEDIDIPPFQRMGVTLDRGH